MGSRGNSGAILAQLLEGFAVGAAGAPRLSTRGFGAAAAAGAAAAREAMAQPREGTILSVVAAFAEEAARRAPETPDFSVLLPLAAAEAKRALLRTKDQLEVLRRAGVVDAGAQGFVYLLEGAVAAFGRGAEPFAPPPEDRVEARIRESRESILFRYCTEALVTGARLERDALRRALAPLGDSIAVVGGVSRLRVHIHVNRPEDAFAVVRRFGDVVETKVEDMRAQHVGRFAARGRVAVVTDSACDLPDAVLESEGITVVPLRLLLGDETFLDKVTITPAEFHRRLSQGRLVAENVSTPARGLSRGLRCARRSRRARARESTSRAPFRAPSRPPARPRARSAPTGASRPSPCSTPGTCPWGRASSCGRPRRAARDGATHAEALAVAAGAASRARLYAAVPSLDMLVRGGRVDRGPAGPRERARRGPAPHPRPLGTCPGRRRLPGLSPGVRETRRESPREDPGPPGADLGGGPLRGAPPRGTHRRGASLAPAGLGRVPRGGRARPRRPCGPGGGRGGLSGLTSARIAPENESLRE